MAAGIRAFELLSESDHLRAQLRENTAYFRSAMQAAGVPVNLLSLDAMPHPFLAFLGVSPGVDQCHIQIGVSSKRLPARAQALTTARALASWL